MKTAAQIKNNIDAAALLRQSEDIARFAAVEAGSVDFETGFPSETFREIADSDLLKAVLPEKFGGANLGVKAGTNADLLKILKNIGRGNLAAGRVFEGHVNALMLIMLNGNPAQIENFAADAHDGKLFGVWNTEANDGVKLHQDGGKFRFSGAKTFASGTGFVTRPFVNCAAENGWQMCVVPMEKVAAKIDESWWKPFGMRATRSFKVDFTDVEIAAENLIGAPQDYYAQPWFSGGAVRFAAIQLGGAESLFLETVKYLRDLRRVDDPYQKMRVGEMAILIESGNLWLDGAARKIDNYLSNPSDETSAQFLFYANLTRTAIEDICLRTMILCEKCVGARGLMRPLPFERIIRDLTIYLRQPAPDAALADAGRFVLENADCR